MARTMPVDEVELAECALLFHHWMLAIPLSQRLGEGR